MVELALYWIGAATAAAGSVGVLAVVVMWSLEKWFKMTGFTKEFLSWYGDKLTKKRDAKRIPA